MAKTKRLFNRSGDRPPTLFSPAAAIPSLAAVIALGGRRPQGWGRLRAVSLGTVLSLFMSHAGAASGRTKNPSSAKDWTAKERAAKKACITGDVKTGIDILGDLYVDTGDATFVFNQGRCYQQNHRLEEAIDRFREYLRKVPNASANDKAEANAHIAECEALLAKQGAGTGSPVQQAASNAQFPTTLPVHDTPPPPIPIQPTTAVDMTQSPRSTSQGRGLRIAGLAATAVGLCAVGTGVALAMKEQSLTNEINAKFSQSKESTRASYETWGYVSYGVGAAAIVGGATLYYLGWRSGKAEPTGIAMLPALTPDAMTLVVHGSF